MRKAAYIVSYSKSVESSLEFRNGLLTRNILSELFCFSSIYSLMLIFFSVLTCQKYLLLRLFTEPINISKKISFYIIVHGEIDRLKRHIR